MEILDYCIEKLTEIELKNYTKTKDKKYIISYNDLINIVIKTIKLIESVESIDDNKRKEERIPTKLVGEFEKKG